MPVQTREKRKRQQELEQKQKEQGDVEQPAQQEEDADKSEERASKKRRGGRKKEAEASTGQSKPAEEAPEKAAADTEKGAEKSVEEQIQKLASEQVVAGVTDEKLHTRVIEKGQVYFFYRQKQLASEVESLDDVQRLYILLNPTSVLPISELGGGESKSTESDQAILNRLLIIGKKQLPDIDAKTKFWGLIYKTSADLEELKGMMENRIPNEQNTSSNQSNKQSEPAVLVGQGLYALVEHGDKHVHLAYALELPEVPGEAQDLFNIRQEDSFVIQVKNPMLATQPLPPAQEKQQKEEKEKEYTKEELESFHKNRWGAPKPLTLLNHPGTEVLIIGASHDIVRELGKPGEMLENEARQMSSQILKIANLVLPKKILSTPAAADQEDKAKEQEGGEGKQQEESTQQRKGADLSLHEQHKKSQESGEATTAPEQQQQQSTSA